MNSFNVYGQTEKVIGGNTPVWLGTVKPIPVGGVINGAARYRGEVILAGSPATYDATSKTVSNIGAIDASTNCYVYNDIHVDNNMADDVQITCAVVMHHSEGLLIERAVSEIDEEHIQQLQEQIPGVLLVRG